MTAFDFGQPASGVIQTAFIVPEVRAAIERWKVDLGAASLGWDGSDPIRPFV